MTLILRQVAMTPNDPKNQDIEIQETIGMFLEEVLKERKIELSDEEQVEIADNLREIIDFSKTTDEDVKNYFNALLTIMGK